MIAFVGDDENCNLQQLIHYGPANDRYERQEELPMSTTRRTISELEDSDFHRSDSDDHEDEDDLDRLQTHSSQPSLTPTLQTPPFEEIEDENNNVDQVSSASASSSLSSQDEKQESLIVETTAIFATNLEETPGPAELEANDCIHLGVSSCCYQGPAVVSCLTKSIDEGSEEGGCQSGDVVVASVEVGEGSATSITDELMNPESEYFSDPDFHDERPGKKSFIELEEERKLRRLRLARQLMFNDSDNEENETHEANEEPEDLFSANQNANDETLPTVDCVVSINSMDEQDEQEVEDEEEERDSQIEDPIEDNQESSRRSKELIVSPNEEADLDTSLNISIESSEHETRLTIESNGDDGGTSQDIALLRNFVPATDETIEIQPVVEAETEVETNSDKQIEAEDKGRSRSGSGSNSISESSIRSSDTINSFVQSVNQHQPQPEEIGDHNFELESECQVVTASEANAELFVDESTLAEDVCSSLKLDSGLSPANNQNLNHQRDITKLDNHRQDSEHGDNYSSDGDEEDATLNGCEFEENLLVERQKSLDDIESDVFNSALALEGEETTNRLEDESEVKIGKKRAMLIEMVSNYCDKLVEMIKEEALMQIKQISISKENDIKRMNITHSLQIESSSAMTPVATTSGTDDALNEENITTRSEPSIMRTDERKIYTSSMYYNDHLESFPTIQKQLEQCRTIAHQLEVGDSEHLGETDNATSNAEHTEDANFSNGARGGSEPTETQQLGVKISDSNNNNDSKCQSLKQVVVSSNSKRASEMFRCRRDRMSRFTFESSDSDSIGKTTNDDNFKELSLLSQSVRQRRASLEPDHLTRAYRHKRPRGKRPEVSLLSDNRSLLIGDSLETIVGQLDCDPANMTDTEYEAPRVRRRPLPTRATTILFGDRTSRMVVEMESVVTGSSKAASPPVESRKERASATSASGLSVKFKPFLDSSTLKDIERLREWSPYGEFNEHNSVSPELCLKLIQGFRQVGGTLSLEGSTTPAVIVESPSDPECSKEQKVIGPTTGEDQLVGNFGREGKMDKGAQLFERRQLQSSDWIVSSGPSHSSSPTLNQPSSSSPPHPLSQEAGENVQDNQESQGKFESKQTANDDLDHDHFPGHLSRPSVSEETVMVADERGEQVIEMVPIIMSHTQPPKLELATVTRTPSFSASSWRVIECDSPDLLTSREDGEETQEDVDDDDEGLDDDNIQDALHIDDDDDNFPPAEQERKMLPLPNDLKVYAKSKFESKFVHGGGRDLLEVDEPINHHLETNRAKIRANLETIETFEVCKLDDNNLTEHFATTSGHARSQSRSSEIHKSTILNWRPQVTTPTWMQTENVVTEKVGEHLEQESSSETEVGRFGAPNADCTISRPPVELAGRGGENNLGRMKQHSQMVSALRDNYQNLIRESTSNTYRSYRYPFADQDNLELNRTRQRRGESCSVVGRSSLELPDSPPKVVSLPCEPPAFLQQRQQDHPRSLRQSSEPRLLAYQDRQKFYSRPLMEEQAEEKGSIKYEDESDRTESYHLGSLKSGFQANEPAPSRALHQHWNHLSGGQHRPPSALQCQQINYDEELVQRLDPYDIRSGSSSRTQKSISMHRSTMFSDRAGGTNFRCGQHHQEDGIDSQAQRSDLQQSVGVSKIFSNNNYELGGIQDHNLNWSSNNRQDLRVEQSRDSSVPPSWKFKPPALADNWHQIQTMRDSSGGASRMSLMESNLGCHNQHQHQSSPKHIIRGDNFSTDRKCHLSAVSGFEHQQPAEQAQKGRAPSGCHRCCCCRCSRANVYYLRVCIKLPNKMHRIVVYHRPKVAFAKLIDQ